jgi:hypothetical protein
MARLNLDQAVIPHHVDNPAVQPDFGPVARPCIKLLEGRVQRLFVERANPR